MQLRGIQGQRAPAVADASPLAEAGGRVVHATTAPEAGEEATGAAAGQVVMDCLAVSKDLGGYTGQGRLRGATQVSQRFSVSI